MSKPTAIVPPPSQPLKTEEMYTEREPHVSTPTSAPIQRIGEPVGGGFHEPGTEPPMSKPRRGVKATSLVALVVGITITWASILVIALPSILYSVPAEIARFIPQFPLFIFLAALGWFFSKKGVEEGSEVFVSVMKCSGVAIGIALAAVVLMRWESGFSYMNPTFLFRLFYLIALAVIGAKSYGMGKAGCISVSHIVQKVLSPRL